jgi:hypothetical protein
VISTRSTAIKIVDDFLVDRSRAVFFIGLSMLLADV